MKGTARVCVFVVFSVIVCGAQGAETNGNEEVQNTNTDGDSPISNVALEKTQTDTSSTEKPAEPLNANSVEVTVTSKPIALALGKQSRFQVRGSTGHADSKPRPDFLRIIPRRRKVHNALKTQIESGNVINRSGEAENQNVTEKKVEGVIIVAADPQRRRKPTLRNSIRRTNNLESTNQTTVVETENSKQTVVVEHKSETITKRRNEGIITRRRRIKIGTTEVPVSESPSSTMVTLVGSEMLQSKLESRFGEDENLQVSNSSIPEIQEIKMAEVTQNERKEANVTNLEHTSVLISENQVVNVTEVVNVTATVEATTTTQQPQTSEATVAVPLRSRSSHRRRKQMAYHPTTTTQVPEMSSTSEEVAVSAVTPQPRNGFRSRKRFVKRVRRAPIRKSTYSYETNPKSRNAVVAPAYVESVRDAGDSTILTFQSKPNYQTVNVDVRPVENPQFVVQQNTYFVPAYHIEQDVVRESHQNRPLANINRPQVTHHPQKVQNRPHRPQIGHMAAQNRPQGTHRPQVHMEPQKINQGATQTGIETDPQIIPNIFQRFPEVTHEPSTEATTPRATASRIPQRVTSTADVGTSTTSKFPQRVTRRTTVDFGSSVETTTPKDGGVAMTTTRFHRKPTHTKVPKGEAHPEPTHSERKRKRPSSEDPEKPREETPARKYSRRKQATPHGPRTSDTV